MVLVHVFRPEALPLYDGRTEAYEAWQENPFEGIELLGVCNDEAEANKLIEKYSLVNWKSHWKFHIEPVPQSMLEDITFPGFKFVSDSQFRNQGR